MFVSFKQSSWWIESFCGLIREPVERLDILAIPGAVIKDQPGAEVVLNGTLLKEPLLMLQSFRDRKSNIERAFVLLDTWQAGGV